MKNLTLQKYLVVHLISEYGDTSMSKITSILKWTHFKTFKGLNTSKLFYLDNLYCTFNFLICINKETEKTNMHIDEGENSLFFFFLLWEIFVIWIKSIHLRFGCVRIFFQIQTPLHCLTRLQSLYPFNSEITDHNLHNINHILCFSCLFNINTHLHTANKFFNRLECGWMPKNKY